MDINKDGYLDITEIDYFLSSLDIQFQERDLFSIFSQIKSIQQDQITDIQFHQLLVKKKNEMDKRNEEENLNAFVALGGEYDKTGSVSVEALMNSIR